MSGNAVKTSMASFEVTRNNDDDIHFSELHDHYDSPCVIYDENQSIDIKCIKDIKDKGEKEQSENEIIKQPYESPCKASQNWFLKAFYYSGTQVLQSSPFDDIHSSSPSIELKDANLSPIFDDRDYPEKLRIDLGKLDLNENTKESVCDDIGKSTKTSNENISSQIPHNGTNIACVSDPILSNSNSEIYVIPDECSTLIVEKTFSTGEPEQNSINVDHKYLGCEDCVPDLAYYGGNLPGPQSHYEVNFPLPVMGSFTPGYNGPHEVDYPSQFIHYNMIPSNLPHNSPSNFTNVIRRPQPLQNSYSPLTYPPQYVGVIPTPYGFKKRLDIPKPMPSIQMDFPSQNESSDDIVDTLTESKLRKSSVSSNHSISVSDVQAENKKTKNQQKNSKTKTQKNSNVETLNVLPVPQIQTNNITKPSVQVLDVPKKHQQNSVRESISFKDLGGNMISLARDQHGSRLIQLRLEKASEDDISQFVGDLISDPQDLVMLMGDVFGNYVIQKLLEHGNEKHKIAIAKTVQGRILELTLQMYGCRVIQKAIECIPENIQIELVMELKDHVLTCIQDQNGNHVIQKCIECISSFKLQFIIEEIHSKVALLSMHPYGCRVIQRIMEFFDNDQRIPVIDQLLLNLPKIILDQYGNYVIQHAYDNYVDPDHRRFIFNYVKDNLYFLSSHKFASNVVEKCLTSSRPKKRRALVLEVVNNSYGTEDDIVFKMMKDGYANYVVQKMLDTTISDKDIELYNLLVSKIRPHYPSLRKLSYGKHIINKIDKICSRIISKTSGIPAIDNGVGLSTNGNNPCVNISSGIHSCSSGASALSCNLASNSKTQVTLDSLTEFPNLINSGMSSI